MKTKRMVRYKKSGVAYVISCKKDDLKKAVLQTTYSKIAITSFPELKILSLDFIQEHVSDDMSGDEILHKCKEYIAPKFSLTW
jgi:hypothetical protein